MDLEYKMKDTALSLKSSTGKPQVVRVEFDPPLLGYEEVKPRLLGMKVDADESLGTVRPTSPFASLPFVSFLKPPPTTPVHFSQIIVNIHTGQVSSNHAFRTTVPDLDHRIPPPLTYLYL